MTVQIPGHAKRAAGDDLAQPITDLLQKLNLESKDEPNQSMDLIKADALDLTKWVAGLLGAGGLLSGAFGSFVAWNVASGHEALKVAIVAAIAVIMSASILMIGWVTTADVRARATTQQTRYEARGSVVRSYFDLVEKADFPDAPAPLKVTVDGLRGRTKTVKGRSA